MGMVCNYVSAADHPVPWDGLTHCLVRGVERDWVHLGFRPLVGPLYQAQTIEDMEHSVEWHLAGETEVLEEFLPRRHLAHNESRPDLASYPDRRYKGPDDNNHHNHTEKVMNMLQPMRSLMCVLVFNRPNTQIGVRLPVEAYRYALSAFSFLVGGDDKK
jgi:hypothetical protein